jgi:ribosome-associated protein
VGETSVDSSAAPVRSAGSALQRALAAARTAKENRATNVAVLDMRELTTIFDYFVLATGTSRRQLHAISEEIDHLLEDRMGDRRLGIEGYDLSRWILLDYGDVVVHLFDAETRAYYSLEDLWGQAKRVEWEGGKD